jgi:voltage-dependent calcium channel L type alpha-1D
MLPGVHSHRRKLYYLVQSKPFEMMIMVVIILNSALMATSFYGQPAEMTSIVEAINYAFTGVYVLEFVLKVGVQG